MRVLIVHPRINVYGGAELVIVKLANYMTELGIDNALLTTSISPEVENELKGTEIIIKETKEVFNKKIPFSEIFALYRGVRENASNFDLINVHNYPAELSVFRCNKPVVWMCNEPILYLMLEQFSSFSRKSIPKTISLFCSKIMLRALFELEKFIVKNYIDYVCVADNFNAKRFKKIYGFEPEIINYGIDCEFFAKGNKNKILSEYGLYNNFIVLQVGWIQPFKNQMESLRTVEKLREKIPNIKLILVGFEDREYRMILDRYIKKNNLEQYVIFTGHLNREKIRDFYHACDVLLHPVKPQGGWLVPFEALCARKPIVVSPEMTASDIIKREGIGMVTTDFAGAIWDIYNNPNKYVKMVERGQMWVRENLNWNKFCENMVKIFYKATGELIGEKSKQKYFQWKIS
jgi:glycosyltransferase involved in cell wall biosynthesis